MNAKLDWSKWSGATVAAAIAFLAVTVQWGMVHAKLDHLEKRIDELILDARSVRDSYADLERRVSFLEGRNER